jgi:hypothetical protein
MAFNPILRAQSGLLFLRHRSIGTDCMNPAATEPGQALPLETHPTKNGNDDAHVKNQAPGGSSWLPNVCKTARADAGRISRPEYQALLQAYLSIALLSVAAMGSSR